MSKIFRRLRFAIIAMLIFYPALAQSTPIIQVDVDGKVTGAKGVIVGGTGRYDVVFVDGTCIEVFYGCNEPSDFPFASRSQVIAAARALLDQVFVGIYDDDPKLTVGCSDSELCGVFIPSGVVLSDNAIGYVIGTAAVNTSIGFTLDDYLGPNDDFGNLADRDLSTDGVLGAYRVWANWVPSSDVPSPATLALLAPGTILLLLRRWRAGFRA
jgi:hypothetical protein